MTFAGKTLRGLATLAITLVALTACDLRNKEAIAPVQLGDEPEFDPNATATLTVPTLDQNILRISASLNNAIAANATEPAQAIARSGGNLYLTTDPARNFPASAGAQTMIVWGYCASLAGNQNALNAYSLTLNGGNIANRRTQLINMGATIFAKASGLSENSPPMKYPTMFSDVRAILDEQLNNLTGATINQAVASVCTSSMLGAFQIGY